MNTKSLKKIKTGKIPYSFLLFIVFFTINLILALPMKYPIITDEYGMLSDAIFLSGKYNWSQAYSTSVNNYWGYGATIWLIPFMPFISGIHSGIILFKIMLTINSFFISLIPVLAFKILRLIKKEIDIKQAFLLALCIGLFPAYIVLSKYAWAETMLSLMPWIIAYMLLCLGKAEKYKKKLLSLFLGLILGYGFSVHGRALVLIVAVFLTIILIRILLKKWIVNWFCMVLPIFVGYILDSIIKNHILSELIISDPGNTRNTIGNILSRNLTGVSLGDSIWQLLKALFGMSYYDIVITFGLISITLVTTTRLVIYLYKSKEMEFDSSIFSEAILSIFSSLIFLGSIALSIIFFATAFLTDSFQRREYFIYGRYTEVMIGIMFLLAVYQLLFSKLITIRQIKCAVLLSTIILLWGTFITSRDLIQNNDKTLSYSMVSGIIPWGGEMFYPETTLEGCLRILVIVLAVFFTLLFLTKKNSFLLYITVIILFSFSSMYSMKTFVWKSSEGVYQSTEDLRSTFDCFYNLHQNFKNIYCIKESNKVLTLQYTLPDYEVTYLNKYQNGYQLLDEITPNSFIISDEDDYFDYLLPNCVQIETSENRHYIWAYGEELISELLNYNVNFEDANTSQVYNATGLFCNDFGLKNENNIFLFNEGISYGPYITLSPGKYSICIAGNNINQCQFYLTSESGQNALDFTVQEINSKKALLSFSSNEFLYDFETLVSNPTERIVIVENITINYEGYQKTEITNLEIPIRSYDVNNKQTRNLISESGNCIRGQTEILFRQGGNIAVTNIYALDYNYEITIKGENLEDIKIEILSEDGSSVDLIYVDEKSNATNKVFKLIKETGKKVLTINLEGISDNFNQFSGVDITVVN